MCALLDALSQIVKLSLILENNSNFNTHLIFKIVSLRTTYDVLTLFHTSSTVFRFSASRLDAPAAAILPVFLARGLYAAIPGQRSSSRNGNRIRAGYVNALQFVHMNDAYIYTYASVARFVRLLFGYLGASVYTHSLTARAAIPLYIDAVRGLRNVGKVGRNTGRG